MRTKKRSLFFAILIVVFLTLAATLNAATPDFDFYKGKVITYIVATKPGGGYDAYARLIGRYLQKNLPGSTVVIKNVPGAGHIIGANETYLARPDGLTIGTFNTGLIYSQIIGQPGVRFDLTKYSWVGKANSELRVLVMGMKAPFKTIKDVLDHKEPILMPSSGVGSQDYNETVILAVALPANFKATPGYAGREGEMAILRGEVHGTIASYTGILGFIKAKECRVLLQYGAAKHKDLPDVPHINDMNLSPKGRNLVALVSTIDELGRLTAAPPGTQPARLEALREAYKKSLNDPELKKEGEKLGLDFDVEIGEALAKRMRDAVNQPEENVKLLKQIIKID